MKKAFLVAVCLGLALSGCQDSTGRANDPAAGATPSEPEVSALCGLGDLEVSITEADGGGSAGARHFNLLVHNTSTTACNLGGISALKFLDDKDQPLGPPAQVSPSQTVTLRPDQSTVADLRVGNATSFDGCEPAQTARALVYFPGEELGAQVDFAVEVCSTEIETVSLGELG